MKNFQSLSILLLGFMLNVSLFAQEAQSPIRLAIDVLIEKADEKLNQAPDTAFIYCKQALQLAEEEEYHNGAAKIHQLLGDIFFLQGAFGQSLPNYMKSVEYYRQTQHKKALAESYHKLGNLYYYTRQPDMAFENQYKALEIYSSINDSLGTAQIYGGLGHLHEKDLSYDSAIFYQNKALTLYKTLDYAPGLANILENIGSVYEDLENYDSAYVYFQQAQSLHENLGNESAQISTLNNLGDVFRKTGKAEEGLKYTEQSLALAQQLDQNYRASSSLRDMSKGYKELGNLDKAYEYLNQSMLLYEDIYSQESARQISLLQTLFDIEQKNGEIQLLERNQRVDQLTKLAILLVVVFLVIMGGLMVSRQRLKIKKNKELIEEREKAYQAEHQLMQAEIDKQQLSEKNLHAEIKSKSKELTTHTLHAITKNQILEELKTDLLEILKDDSTRHKKDLKKIVRKIDTNFQRDEEWAHFTKMFTKVHESFYDHLSEQFPDLTLSEKRLASLIKLNISSRDIATIMAISPDSLRIARYRLRKKMNIEREVKLESFIQNI